MFTLKNLVVRTGFPPFKSTSAYKRKSKLLCVGKEAGLKTLLQRLHTPFPPHPSHAWPSHPLLQVYHPEISKPSSVLCTGSFLCLECRHSSLVPHSVLYLAHSSHPQAESVSPLFVLPFLTSLKPLNTLDIAVTTHVSVSPTKLRADYKQMPHLTHVEILGGESNT